MLSQQLCVVMSSVGFFKQLVLSVMSSPLLSGAVVGLGRCGSARKSPNEQAGVVFARLSTQASGSIGVSSSVNGMSQRA